MNKETAIKVDLECLAADIRGTYDLLHIVVDDMEENTINPPRIKMDANAIRQCAMMIDKTADEMISLARRIKPEPPQEVPGGPL